MCSLGGIGQLWADALRTLVCDTRLPVADKVWRFRALIAAVGPTSTTGWVLLTSPFPVGHNLTVNTTIYSTLLAQMAMHRCRKACCTLPIPLLNELHNCRGNKDTRFAYCRC